MNFWISLGLATLLLLTTIIVFATKLFFPYHRIIALVIYGIGWIPFLYSIWLRKQWILDRQDVVSSFFHAYWMHLVFGVIMLGVVYVLFVLFPPVKSAFSGLSQNEIQQIIKEDRDIVFYLNDQLDNEISSAKSDQLFSLDFQNITNDQKQQLKSFWISTIEAMLQLDILKERYSAFYQLNVLTQPELHKNAFKNGYAALLTQHRHAFQLAKLVQDHNLNAFLNQRFPEHGIERNTFDLMKEKLTNADELLKLNAGRGYYHFIRNEGSKINQLINSHLTSIDEAVPEYTDLIAKKPLDFLERNSFKLWFPIQKKAATQISYVRTTTRDYHIHPKQIQNYKDRLLPGDIFLERREWHATNVGIPGFWTHAALYIGSLNEMEDYFKGLDELNGNSVSEYLKKNHPEVYKQMQKKDEDGFEYAVMEAKRPGVILTSLEYTANADSFAALRVKDLTKSDRFKIVTQAMDYLGRPYDFDFNFVTDAALVCSELVYKAYTDISQLNMQLQQVNGRPIISPNQFAEKFTREHDQDDPELELVLFLDGNEKEGVATEKGAGVFKESWKRPKWHVVKDFVDYQ